MSKMDEIELRSKNIRRIIGPIPKGLFIGGITVMVLITAALSIALFYLPNPTNSSERLFHLIIKSLKL